MDVWHASGSVTLASSVAFSHEACRVRQPPRVGFEPTT